MQDPWAAANQRQRKASRQAACTPLTRFARSAVIDHLTSYHKLDGPIITYYCNALSNRPVTAADLVRGLMRQLLKHIRGADKGLNVGLEQSLSHAFSHKSLPPQVPQLMQVLVKLLVAVGSCYIVLDGLDAMSEPEILQCTRLLREVLETCLAQRGLRMKILLFGRETLGRGIRLDELPTTTIKTIGIEQVLGDVRKYVDHEINLRQRDRAITQDHSLLAEVKKTLVAHAEKMFVWVKLQISTLWDPSQTTCDEDIRAHLVALPEGLDDIYMRCLSRVEETNDNRSSTIAPRAFKWVAFAKRPLTDRELRELANVEPEDIPVKQSMVLNTSVVDYCANLLVLNSAKGVVEFAHSTVKQFLLEKERLPTWLQRYALSEIEDNLWCGRICLAYARHHHSRNALVQYTTQYVDPSLNATLLGSTLGRLATFGKLRSPRKYALSPIAFPIPARRINVVVDTAMYRYMCTHWLTHNEHIVVADTHYPDFVDLCLAHDADLQSWTTTNTAGKAHHQRQLEFAVVNNHIPLLNITIEHVKRSPKLLSEVLKMPCHGTDSSLLHLAAALNHTRAAEILCRESVGMLHLADAQGKSALALAAECHCNGVFAALWALDPRSSSQRHVRTLGGTVMYENLVNICASAGNTKAMEMVLDKIFKKSTSKHHPLLLDALFHACSNGKVNTATRLLVHGATPHILPFRFPTSLEEPVKICRNETAEHSLQLALKARNVLIMATLLSIGAHWSPERHCVSLKDIIQEFKHDPASAQPFIDAVVQHETSKRNPMTMFSTIPDLEDTVLYLIHEKNLSGKHAHNVYLRIMIDSIHRHGEHGLMGKILWVRPRLFAVEETFLPWLEYVSDDLIVRFLQGSWEYRASLILPNYLRTLGKRLSSRGLETMIDAFYVSMDIGNLHEVDLADVLGTVVHKSYHEMDRSKVLPVFFKETRVIYNELLTSMVISALADGRVQIVEFLVCFSDAARKHVQFVLTEHMRPPLADWMVEASPAMLESCHVLMRALVAPSPSTKHALSRLAWIRCYKFQREDSTQALLMFADLPATGHTGNLALNAPAGYTFITRRSFIRKQPIVSYHVEQAVYGWAFRLNRKHHKDLSDADMMYAALLLKSYWRSFYFRRLQEDFIVR